MPNEITCREEVKKAVRNVIKVKGKNEFHPKEVVDYMKENGTQYKKNTIMTHITSRCCKNAPEHHQTRYEDFERIDRGLYRLLGV